MIYAVLFLLVIVLLGAAIYLSVQFLEVRREAKRLTAELAALQNKSEHDQKEWTTYADALETENRRLAKYEGIADADAQAVQLMNQAQSTLADAQMKASTAVEGAGTRAASILAESQQQANAIHDEAVQQSAGLRALAADEVRVLKEQAKSQLDHASTKASLIIDQATKRAEEIGGSAYEAMKNADLYARTAQAMKNIIEGYGDQYLIPAHSLLDDLAEDFGHTQAGTELKKAREATKAMIRTDTAATCQYVEASRRNTAINFVLDAFNGKVDSSLSRVRESNAGTLEQEIRDAFTLVNFNGKAFREACITEQFLNARLSELKWAAVVQQLKVIEREEQRLIKEEIREEEKARREYERAMREAVKDEETLRKAMEKAQLQVDEATAEQKAKYEQKLQELSEKLKEAEERNQRALSMAQQTKRGHVYVISNIGSFGENVYKIGLTRRLEPLDRIRELGDSSVPFAFDVHALIFSEDAPALEYKLHNHFVLLQMNKVNYRKEFFKVDLAHIHQEIEKLGLTAKWTMTAAAQEYRESLAIEKAIQESPTKREAWIRRQFEMGPIDDLSSEPVTRGEDVTTEPPDNALSPAVSEASR